jgi:hypothetical protein
MVHTFLREVKYAKEALTALRVPSLFRLSSLGNAFKVYTLKTEQQLLTSYKRFEVTSNNEVKPSAY